MHKKHTKGQFTVIDQGEAKIELYSTKPHNVKVEFKDHCHHHGCNPHFDKLFHYIGYDNHKHLYLLTVKWHVADVRTIIWSIE